MRALLALVAVVLAFLAVAIGCGPSELHKRRSTPTKTVELRDERREASRECDIGGLCWSCMNVGPAMGLDGRIHFEIGKPSCSMRFRNDCFKGEQAVTERVQAWRHTWADGRTEDEERVTTLHVGKCVRQ
jgi:hypothetical protein